MGAMTYNIPDIEIGTTFKMEVTVADPQGVPFDLSTYTPVCEGRVAPADVEAAFDFTCDIPSAGVISLELSDADTATIPVGRYFYRLLIGNGTETYPVIKGYCSVGY